MNDIGSRQIKEMLYLLEIETPISLEEMSRKVRIKVRTIKKDFDIIENFLSDEGFELVRKSGVKIVSNKKDASVEKFREKLLKTLQYSKLDSEDRMKVILSECILKEKMPTAEEWSFRFNISKPSVLKDIVYLKDWLGKKEIILEGKPGVGYCLEGKEESIRDALFNFLFEDNFSEPIQLNCEILRRELNSVLGSKSLEATNSFLVEVEKKSGTKLTDIDFLILSFKLALSIERVKNGHSIVMDPNKVFYIKQLPEYKIMYETIKLLEDSYKIKLSDDEIAYFTVAFVSSKSVDESLSLDTENISEDAKYVYYAKKITDVLNDIAGISLQYDEEFLKMLALHLKTAITKIRYGLPIKNPILDDIKDKYPFAFNIAKRVLAIIGKEMHMKIPEDEVGYIAMYISVAFEKAKYSLSKNKKVAVVCSSGMGTSSFLFWRLRNEMPDLDILQVGSFKELLKRDFKSQVDLIISTIPLPDFKLPYVVVSPFLTYDERKAIRGRLNMLNATPPNVPFVDDIFDDNLIFTNLSCKSSVEAIELMGNALFDRGFVEEGFVESVIEREKKFPTGLSTFIPIALPHTTPDFTKKEGFAIATLKEPVVFKDMGNPKHTLKVKIILIPVLLPKGPFNSFFSQLIDKLGNIKVERNLILSKTPQDVKKVLL